MYLVTQNFAETSQKLASFTGDTKQ